ncbi:unnamed protein product [Parajaminaea phylloscopi]
MRGLTTGALALTAAFATASSHPLSQRHLTARAEDSAASSAASAVSLDSTKYVSHGLVAFGRIANTALDSFGESLGGLGSAIALEAFQAKKDGSYTGSIRLQPDRGHNQGGLATSDYRARSHLFDLQFQPLGAKAKTPAAENLKLTYKNTLLYKKDVNFTTGLDPDVVQSGQPPLPIASFDRHLSVDSEGLAIYGSVLFASDEYGPYIYTIEKATGQIISTLAPPDAIVPLKGGSTNFTALVDPDTGRAANKGFEGLTLDRTTGILWALLQEATVQDGGSDKTTSRYSRLLGYKVDEPDTLNALKKKQKAQPKPVHEYVVELPQSKKGKTRGASELHIVGGNHFLVLARDGNGFGDTDSDSSYKQAALLSVKHATDIAGTKYDSPTDPVAPKGSLVKDITPATVKDFVDLVDKDELAKFGLHTGGDFDRNLIASKLESLAVATVGDKDKPDDYFLFVVSDNDFITTQGKQAGQVNGKGDYVVQSYSDPYAEKYGSQDTQVFVYRVTLPGYKQPLSSGPN